MPEGDLFFVLSNGNATGDLENALFAPKHARAQSLYS